MCAFGERKKKGLCNTDERFPSSYSFFWGEEGRRGHEGLDVWLWLEGERERGLMLLFV
jgi:hypothetical protein